MFFTLNIHTHNGIKPQIGVLKEDSSQVGTILVTSGQKAFDQNHLHPIFYNHKTLMYITLISPKIGEYK